MTLEGDGQRPCPDPLPYLYREESRSRRRHEKRWHQTPVVLQGAHRALCPRCAKRRLFSLMGIKTLFLKIDTGTLSGNLSKYNKGPSLFILYKSDVGHNEVILETQAPQRQFHHKGIQP